ncbi:MAG: hypothetical protein OXH25_00370, partial [Chloroflexi bacterium]|nr:hypothetical protein [Chloroflexota bacterium]
MADIPMLRDIPQPHHAQRFEAGRWVEAGGAGCLGWEAARHRAGDQRRPILLQPLNQQPLLR